MEKFIQGLVAAKPFLMIGIFLTAVAVTIASADASDRPSRYGASGVFPGDTTNAHKNPHLLAPRGFGKINKSGVSAKKARIAFQEIRGGLTFHNNAINKFAPAFVRKNKVKVVGINQNPTHIIKARLTAQASASGVIGQYNWVVIDAKTGRKVQTFVDLVRGGRVPSTLRWSGLSIIEIKNLSQIAADRLVYWLNAGAS